MTRVLQFQNFCRQSPQIVGNRARIVLWLFCDTFYIETLITSFHDDIEGFHPQIDSDTSRSSLDIPWWYENDEMFCNQGLGMRLASIVVTVSASHCLFVYILHSLHYWPHITGLRLRGGENKKRVIMRAEETHRTCPLDGERPLLITQWLCIDYIHHSQPWQTLGTALLSVGCFISVWTM